MATAVRDTAMGPRKPLQYLSRHRHAAVHTRHLQRGEGIKIGGVHEQIEGADDEHAANEGTRHVFLRVANFAGQRGNVVPAVISP